MSGEAAEYLLGEAAAIVGVQDILFMGEYALVVGEDSIVMGDASGIVGEASESV